MPWRTATSTPRPATALHRPSCLDRAVSSPRAGLPGRRRRGRLHRALLLLEAKHLPVYYFPAQDVRTELLEPSDTRTHFPYKGDACYWSVRVGKRVARDAVWSYQDPPGRAHRHQGLSSRVLDPDGCLVRRGRRGFRPPRDPCHRVDVLSSSWHVAREALGHDQLAQPRAAGHHAGLAVRLAARRSAVQAASDAQRQLHALVVAASDSLRGRLRELEPTR